MNTSITTLRSDRRTGGGQDALCGPYRMAA